MRPGNAVALAAGAGLAAGVAAAGYWGVAAAVTRPGRRLLDGRLVLCSVRTDKPLLALTFDDGPDPAFTERFIAALSGAPCTFFALGARVRRAPRLAGEIVAAGHELACHGDTHRSLASLPPAATVAALRCARDSIADACGRPPRFYRPAYGVFNLAGWAVAPRLGMRRTLWSAWARDWEERATPALIAARTLRAAKPGAILLLHDADGSPGAPERTLAALPVILDGLRECGLRTVTLSELVAAGDRARQACVGPLVQVGQVRPRSSDH
jgi:peptidoglycan/xylan/chitin deacetylase (PgdA/CDA1 family)